MGQCVLCNKKASFFDCYYVLPENYLICGKCNEEFKKMESATQNIDTYTEYYEQFVEQFSNSEKIDDFRKYFNTKSEMQRLQTEIKEQPIKEEPITQVCKNENIGPFENQDIVYKIDGVRGKHIDVYKDKIVIVTRVTLGSIVAHNATDGEKTIYYSDCIGIQYKPSGFLIGYLQLETASNAGNNKKDNFWEENSFTFDSSVISDERMNEVVNYIKSRVDQIKNIGNSANVTNSISVADELLKLKQLLDMGVLSQEEFNAQKQKLLNN